MTVLEERLCELPKTAAMTCKLINGGVPRTELRESGNLTLEKLRGVCPACQ